MLKNLTPLRNTGNKTKNILHQSGPNGIDCKRQER